MFCGLAVLYFFVILRIHATPTPEESVESVVRRKLTEHLKPIHLEVVNKSAKEGAPPDSDHLHFSVKVVTPMFSEMPLLKRHQLVNEILKEELKTSIHALTIYEILPPLPVCKVCQAVIIGNGMSNEDRGPVETGIREKLTSRLRPMYLDVINQSILYGEKESDERVFTVIVVSSVFAGTNSYQRHLCVNGILEDEMANHVHALTIIAKTPDEWRQEHYATPTAEPLPDDLPKWQIAW